MAVSLESGTWESVIELTEVAQQKGSDPLLWALQLSSSLSSAGVTLPSVELADLLVSYICWDNNVPILWKFLEKALMLNTVPPMLLLALLSTRFVLLCSVFLCFLFSVSIGFVFCEVVLFWGFCDLKWDFFSGYWRKFVNLFESLRFLSFFFIFFFFFLVVVEYLGCLILGACVI